ncbi:MAG: high frequency lysogenization protein HflD [Acidithiobacillus sp.]|uniref:high frequency lysogenization protein HflD n=1 Tax=Acidithiobacillus sp. TaxID=1872118 RepID=UPI0025B7C643|nr:high frequency lysogenization protein HflD [Acidithiobacillus sp.]
MAMLTNPARRADRTLALAGILRAAQEVQDAARRGIHDNSMLGYCVQSILSLEGRDSAAVLGGLPSLRRALQGLCPLLQRGPGSAEEAEQMRYALSLAKLGKALTHHHGATERVRRGIDEARRQIEHFGDPIHPSVLGGLANTYAEGIGILSPRIIVSGESRFLTQEEDTVRIRTLLLAGVRAAVLWRQAGGSVFTTFWERGALCLESRDLLAHLSS